MFFILSFIVSSLHIKLVRMCVWMDKGTFHNVIYTLVDQTLFCIFQLLNVLQQLRVSALRVYFYHEEYNFFAREALIEMMHH